jgi:acyl-CoA synthetase (AMP-forming)/AMP-acid ligase II
MNGVLSIGKPMKNMEAIIVDENNRSLATKNEKGELCLTGSQITLGYWKNEWKNSEAFFTNDGKKYYRTGDMCICDEEGDYFYTGRIDFQVKINGFRVELNEIEYHARTFLKSHAIVAHACQNEIGGAQIFLFVENFSKNFDELTHYLKTKLPSYMIPSKTFNLELFPLNSNGKVDRKALIKMIS